MSSIFHVFLGVDMRVGHIGLQKYAKKQNVDLKGLDEGSAVLFINKNKSKMKAYSWNDVVSYVRQEDDKRPIDLTFIDKLSQAFDAQGRIDYPKALRQSLAQKLMDKKLKPTLLK